jgi:hypothetical protein
VNAALGAKSFKPVGFEEFASIQTQAEIESEDQYI